MLHDATRQEYSYNYEEIDYRFKCYDGSNTHFPINLFRRCHLQALQEKVYMIMFALSSILFSNINYIDKDK